MTLRCLTQFRWGTPVAKRIDQQGKRRRRLTPAWVIEVVSRKERTPIFKYPIETTLGEVRQRQVLRHIRQAEAPQGAIEHFEKCR